MAAERNAGAKPFVEKGDARQETLTADAFEPGVSDGVASLVEMHRRVAARLLSEGSPSKAFGELVRASRAVPMTPRLAAYLVAFSLRAGAEPAAVTLLQTGLEDAEGEVRAAIRRQLVRLFRRLDETERAREHLILLLAEQAGDRRARRVLNALLEHDERWEELDASLEKQAREALKRGRLSRAAQATLHRARVFERLGNAPRAALRYAQAANYLDQAKQPGGAFDLRILWLRSLREADAPAKAIAEAVDAFNQSAAAANQQERARGVLEALGLAPAGNEPPTRPRPKVRAQTQRELLAAAEVAEASGRAHQAEALFTAAVSEGPDPATLRRLEAHYVARRAWRELAQFYRDRVGQARSPQERIEYLTRLAELLEDELNDNEGAAGAYEQIVKLTGDADALREQVRLLSAKKDASGVRRALDSAVDAATSTAARARALTARAEALLRKREWARARADFEAALGVDPGNLLARAGFAESAARLGDLKPFGGLREALKTAPRRFPGRAELLRRMARLATAPVGDVPAAKWAWTELVAEVPNDAEAEEKLAELARRSADDGALEQVLRTVIQRDPRGPKTRGARLELVALLERTRRADEGLAALRDAVRFEPGHKEAWLLLSERCATRGLNGESAWALEQAATSTEDELERAQTWARLGRFVREVLKDPEKAQVFERRAKKIQVERGGPQISPLTIPAPAGAAPEADRARTETGAEDPDTKTPTNRVSGGPEAVAPHAPAPPAPPAVTPSGRFARSQAIPRTSSPVPGSAPAAAAHAAERDRAHTEFELPAVLVRDEEDSVSDWKDVDDDRSGPLLEPLSALSADPAVAADEDVLEVTTGDLEPVGPVFEEWDAPPGELDSGPSTVELPVPLGESQVLATPSLPTPALQKLRADRERLLARVREDPLDAEAYRLLAGYFDEVGDADRSALMAELANALEGDPHAAPRAPRLILSATDRAGLRHPSLRGEEGELLTLAGIALCRAAPDRASKASQARDEFRLDSGRGAQVAADALLSAVRILGLRAPDVFLSEDNGPPFSLAYTPQGPRLLVGRLAVKKELPEAELRFFAGRALFTQNPDLLALRTLKKEQLARGLSVLASVVRGGRQLSGEGRAMREGLAPKAMPRIQELLSHVGRELPLAALTEGARHSANRAGLVVCGSVAPALSALRAKKSLRAEIVELIRFAASERYLRIRSRRYGSQP